MKFQRRTFLKQLGLGAAGCSLATSLPVCLAAEGAVSHQLPRSAPEAQGVASTEILAFLDAVEKSSHEFHSFMMLRHGHVIAEGWWAPYRSKANHMLYSLSKSFTSTAVGFAVTEGKLKVEDRVIQFFPEFLPEKMSDYLAAMRVRDLLTMSVGHAKDSTPDIRSDENWVKAFLAYPITNAPGSVFLYNSGATYMLSAIVQKVSGQKTFDYLRPRLFEPLGLENIWWETCPRGINTGGWGLNVQTECLAKFGQFYLQRGAWNGKQILPEAWIEQATTFKIQQPGADLEKLKQTSDSHQGYCYQFWRCRHDAFRGDGAMGQYTVVLPHQDAVIAITCETANMHTELDLVWQHLLPAIKDQPLPADVSSAKQLKQKLASLRLPLPYGSTMLPETTSSPRDSSRTFQLAPNDAGVQSVTFRFQRDTCTFTLKDAKGSHSIKCGLHEWVDGETDLPGTPPKLTPGSLGPKSKVAAAAGWKENQILEMVWHFYETPHHDTVTCHFDGDHVKIEFLNSITQKSSGHPETRSALFGQMAV